VSGPLAELREMSLYGRCVTVGAAVCGTGGAIVGLIVGLLDDPQTAWFALAEVGVPTGLLGALIGLSAAVLVTASRRLTRSRTPTA
jgi:membrane associated rhomboid family serine protease